MKTPSIKFLPAIMAASVLTLTSCEKEQLMDSRNAGAVTQKNTEAVGNRYIVTFKGGAATGSVMERPDFASKHARTLMGRAFNGMAMELNAQELEQLRNDPNVLAIEPDYQITVAGGANRKKNNDQIIVPSGTTGGDSTSTGGVTYNSSLYPITPMAGQTLSWGATRVGIGDGAATGRTAWVIDSGIQLDHPDLNVDVARSRSYISTSTSPTDQFGHGTQVAGILAAKNNGFGVVGVASGATVVSLRVMDASGAGSVSAVISALNYVAQNAQPGDVVNLSLGASPSLSLDNAVLAVANLGIFVTIAADNSNANAANYSPARVNHANVFTVSGMRPDNTFMGISNWGSPVDFCAPGNSIQTTKINSTYGSAGGTSMAAPHVAGVLLMRGSVLSQGNVLNDPDGNPDPIAKL